jgi:hypothetical protein
MESEKQRNVELPAPTAWPMVFAFGIALIFAGLITNMAVAVVGFFLFVRAAVGWWKEVLPVEKQESITVVPGVGEVQPSSRRTAQFLRAGQSGHRVRIPAEIHPYSSGIKGGIVGAVAMAIVACAFGLFLQGSLWYPINLLAAAAMPSMANADLAQLKAFNASAFAIATVIHGVMSILVGLLYAVLLPMLPLRYAPYYCSFVAPFFWTAVIWSLLGLINPTLEARIDWTWFIFSQIAFGATCGYVVAHSAKIETLQTWPLAARAGLEIPGLMEEKGKQE